MLIKVFSGALIGVKAHPVDVEVNFTQANEPRSTLVGLPDLAVKEAQDRVAAAMRNSGFEVKFGRTTINLAPASLRKEGSCFDLPIALGLVATANEVKMQQLHEFIIAGELGLSGNTRPVKGGLALAMLAREKKMRGVLLPVESAYEGSLVEGIEVYPVNSLDQAVRFLKGEMHIEPISASQSPFRRPSQRKQTVCFSEIKGQEAVKRALEVAVAGGHNILMIGPPGSGKSMMSKRIASIMPEPTLDEYLEIVSIHSAAGTTLSGEYQTFERPFRSPHHTISDVGLLGGGNPPGPGEISLAHHGVLFLDELPEFRRSTLEVLRQPLEDGCATISRSKGKVTFPSAFMLVAAMNPCPCGYLGDSRRECRCSSMQILRYRSRISGPLLDRIDIHIEAPAVPLEALRVETPSESSETIRKRIDDVRKLQASRFQIQQSINCNAHMNHRMIQEHCAITDEQANVLQEWMKGLALSARAYDRILKVSRTIADLAGTKKIETDHLMEAIQYRNLDRTLFN